MSDKNIRDLLNNRDYLYIIPEKVLFDMSLSMDDLRVFGIISAFTHLTGEIPPVSDFLDEKLNLNAEKISSCINNLVEKNYIFKKRDKLCMWE